MKPKQSEPKNMRSEVREAGEIILGVITNYRRIAAKDRKQLREHIVELLTDDEGVPRLNYFVVCRALQWLYSKRRINMGIEKKSGLYVVSPR